jgi:predicted alpha/beta-hydrolase family hydrolase
MSCMSIDVQDIAIPIARIELEGSLAFPTRAAGLVIFAHGSGSSRHSPRNRHVAELLNERGLATLLFDLLTAEEERIDAVDATLHAALRRRHARGAARGRDR